MDRVNRYTFVPKKRDIISNGNIKLEEIKFYQIALYSGEGNKYHIRRFIIDGENKVASVASSYFSKRKVEKFVEKRRKNSFKIYPVYSLDTVTYPTPADIDMARSDILNTDNQYTGYAPYPCS